MNSEIIRRRMRLPADVRIGDIPAPTRTSSGLGLHEKAFVEISVPLYHEVGGELPFCLSSTLQPKAFRKYGVREDAEDSLGERVRIVRGHQHSGYVLFKPFLNASHSRRDH